MTVRRNVRQSGFSHSLPRDFKRAAVDINARNMPVRAHQFCEKERYFANTAANIENAHTARNSGAIPKTLGHRIQDLSL